MGRKSALGLLTTAFLAASCAKHEAPLTPAQEFVGPWRESADMSLTMALAKAEARDCGSFYFKDSIRNPQQALVYCTGDGQRWTAWTVSRSSSDPRHSTAVGPFHTEPDIPPPSE